MKSKIIINVKKLTSILLCTISISSTMPSNLLNSTAFAKDENNITTSNQDKHSTKEQDNKEHILANNNEQHVSTFSINAEDITWPHTVKNFQELQDAINDAPEDEKIYLVEDITIPRDKQLCISNKNITITSFDKTKKIEFESSENKNELYRIKICDNCTVNLENIIINLPPDIYKYVRRESNNGIIVSNQSTLNIKQGTTIQNNKFGYAICSDNSKILLNGGNICDCDNTAICLMNNSSFEQNGGKISNCDQAIYSCDSTIMQAFATIDNCGCSEKGASKALTTLIHPYGGAIYSENSNIQQNNVTISNCDAERGGAIYSKNSSIKQDYVNIFSCTANYGGAIYLAETSSLEYRNETIHNCTAHDDGGAIYATESSSISLYKASIDSCKAKNGGAIYSREIDFTSKDNFIKLHNSSIKNCSATSTDKIFCNLNKPIGGGAIYIDGFNPPKTKEADIKGSTITNCSSCRDGGAIIACGNSSLSLDNNSKIINCTSNNESIGKGNAIYTDYNAKLAIDDKCEIRFDDNCKINKNKDNGEQEYKYKGIFDEKLDKNNTPKVDNNNPHPFKITSPIYYEIKSKNEYKNFDTITFYGTGTPGYKVNIFFEYNKRGSKCPFTQREVRVEKDGSWSFTVPISEFKTNINFYSSICHDKESSMIWTPSIDGYFEKSKPLRLWFFHTPEDELGYKDPTDKIIKFLKHHDIYCRRDNNKDLYVNIGRYGVYNNSFYDSIGLSSANIRELKESEKYKQCGEINLKSFHYSLLDTDYECQGLYKNKDYYYSYWCNPFEKQQLGRVLQIDNISFIAQTTYPKSIISNMAYFKTDKLYYSHTEIPKNANWITPPIKTTKGENLMHPLFATSSFATEQEKNEERTYINPTIKLEEGKFNDEFYIYFKLTDIFNNIRYSRFNGRCLIHKDIKVEEDKITKDNVTYEKLTKKDKELSLTLNGNTLYDEDDIVRAIGDKKEPLKKDIDYKIKENNKIIIMQNYLNKLKDITGSYFTIYYNPAGKPHAYKAPHSIYMYTKKPDKVKVTDYKYSNSTTPTISGTGKKGYLVSITNENKEVIGTTTVDENGKWQITTSKLPKDTNHKIFIFQTDLEANTTSDPFEYTKPKPVTVTSCKEPVSKRPRIFGTGEKGCKVTVQDKNGKTIETNVHNDGKWEITPNSDLSYGENTLCIFQTNQAGIQSDPIYHKISIVKLTMKIDNKEYSSNDSKIMTQDTFINLKLLTNNQSNNAIKIEYSTENSGWIPYKGRVVGIALKKNEITRKERIRAKATDNNNNTVEIESPDIYFYTPTEVVPPSDLLNCNISTENAQPANKEIPVPMLRTPKRIGINSNVNQSKIYLNNSKTNKGVKTISAKGTPGCTIKIKTRNDKVIGEDPVLDSGECTISLKNEFNKLKNGEVYPLSIYQEDNSSKEKSNSLDATFCILNTPPTIKFFYKDTDTYKEIQEDNILYPYAVNGIKIEATDKIGNKIEQGNLEVFEKADAEATEEELKNDKNWKPYNGLWNLIREQNRATKRIYLYVKAKDKAGNISSIKYFSAFLFTPTTTK